MSGATEEWRVVPGFPDYEVSDLGRVRRVTGGQGTRGIGFVLKPFPAKRGGYNGVGLMRERKRNTKLIAPLVCEAFNGPKPEGLECCHRDGNHLNDTLANLYWGTRAENVKDAMRHGTWFNVGRDGRRWRT